MDFSTALCDPTGEHGGPGRHRCRCTSASVPRPSGRCSRAVRRQPRARRRLHHERPVRRRDAHAGHLRRQAASSPATTLDRLRRARRRITPTSAAGCRAAPPPTTPRSSRRACACHGCGSTPAASPSKTVFKVHPDERPDPRHDDGRHLRAQVAACDGGERGLHGAGRAIRRRGSRDDHGRRCSTTPSGWCAPRSRRWPDGTASFTDYLDSDGDRAPIDVPITVDADDPRATRVDRRLLGLRPDGRAARSTARTRSPRPACTCAVSSPRCRPPMPNTAGAFRPITVDHPARDA